ncbi:unknown protein [Seminavis robusta]|uniref:Uncharacterized protein n=1 Tax=Seminavis robusta TaxID=568900 RepID=A0A9N8EQ64_9STRA|nr:unknown protein [Seminavis robusta]|eukprot:Sro1421_g271170.1 n/a (98) ;mRNA; r:315-608
MIRTHTHMFRDQGLNETHYDVAAHCFAEGLQTFQVDQGLIDKCMTILVSMRVVFEYGAQVAEREKTMSKEKMKTPPLASPKTIGTDQEVVLPEYPLG